MLSVSSSCHFTHWTSNYQHKSKRTYQLMEKQLFDSDIDQNTYSNNSHVTATKTKIFTNYQHYLQAFVFHFEISQGSSRSFNITSSKSFGNYYEVVLRHQSIDKLHCNEEVEVTCKLIKEYIIPTEDRRKCVLKGILLIYC